MDEPIIEENSENVPIKYRFSKNIEYFLNILERFNIQSDLKKANINLDTIQLPKQI